MQPVPGQPHARFDLFAVPALLICLSNSCFRGRGADKRPADVDSGVDVHGRRRRHAPLARATLRRRHPGRRYVGLRQRRHQGWRDRLDVLGHCRHAGRRRHRVATRLSNAVLLSGFAVHEFRPAASASYIGGDIRFRRQRLDRDVVLCRSAHVQRAARGRALAVVRLLGLSDLHPGCGHRLSARRHARGANTPSRNGTRICG